jgi:hypothetical protein
VTGHAADVYSFSPLQAENRDSCRTKAYPMRTHALRRVPSTTGALPGGLDLKTCVTRPWRYRFRIHSRQIYGIRPTWKYLGFDQNSGSCIYTIVLHGPQCGTRRFLGRTSQPQASVGSVPEGHRSPTLRVVLRPTEAMLTAEEIGVVRNRTLAALSQELGAHLR